MYQSYGLPQGWEHQGGDMGCICDDCVSYIDKAAKTAQDKAIAQRKELRKARSMMGGDKYELRKVVPHLT